MSKTRRKAYHPKPISRIGGMGAIVKRRESEVMSQPLEGERQSAVVIAYHAAIDALTRIKRLTPIIPGVRQPVLFIDDKVITGFFGGEATQGRGFPQWAMDIWSAGGIAHYFRAFDAYGTSESLCGRVDKHWKHLHLPGNYPRCKDCERKVTKALRSGRPV